MFTLTIVNRIHPNKINQFIRKLKKKKKRKCVYTVYAPPNLILVVLPLLVREKGKQSDREQQLEHIPYYTTTPSTNVDCNAHSSNMYPNKSAFGVLEFIDPNHHLLEQTGVA